MLAVCPRCQRANPSGSVYCWFDGGSLLSAQAGVQRLAKDFLFPSGRRCQTLEDFAQACQDEWSAARDLLSKDAFRQYFIGMGRLDLVRLAQEVMQQPNPDVGLSRFIDGLPVVQTRTAKLDLQPRRFTLGRLPAGDRREIELSLINQGSGALQGTVTVTAGADWLSFPDHASAQTAVQATGEQCIRMTIDAGKLQSAQSYVGQLMVVTNGGVAEVPVRFELVARPFAKAPFQGVRTPRELAEKMRAYPKQAGPMLEGGDVERWFAANNWDYPVQGPVAKGLAGVQQFFEAMGLSRPPQLTLSQRELRLSSFYPDAVRAQVLMQTSSRKWVYGQIRSTQPWLKVLTPKVIGPQHAAILLEADPTQLTTFPPAPAALHIVGNGGQKLELPVSFDVKDPPQAKPARRWRPVFAAALLFLAVRLALIPVVDLHARAAALASAARIHELTPDASLLAPGGWLQLPWASLLAGFDAPTPLDALTPMSDSSLRAGDFRNDLIRALVREIVLWMWWLGPVAMIVVFLRRPETRFALRDLVPAVVAGTVAGVLLAATLGCVFVAVEIVPHALWSLVFGRASGAGWLTIWLVVTTLTWTALGAGAGFVFAFVGSRRR